MTEDAGGTGAPFAAAFVLGIEGDVSPEAYDAVVQRLDRAIRPWDVVVPVDDTAVCVHCTSLTSTRETQAIAERLADVVRAPLAVGDEILTFGVCVGSATRDVDGDSREALARAATAMRQMRDARSGLLDPGLPAPREGAAAFPG